uniref:hypothetical protein n=1 Tax=Neorhizobium sp. EC2-8 TaxID=3129230 RepID=UPI0031013DF0
MISPKPSSHCTLVIGDIGSEDAVEMPGDVIFPPSGEIPASAFKGLLKTEYLDATFGFEKIDFKTAQGWDVDVAKPLHKWIMKVHSSSAFCRHSRGCDWLRAFPIGQ